MVFNAVFNNISAIPWRSVLLVEETGEYGKNHRPTTHGFICVYQKDTGNGLLENIFFLVPNHNLTNFATVHFYILYHMGAY
jgi:hypothetical protein